MDNSSKRGLKVRREQVARVAARCLSDLTADGLAAKVSERVVGQDEAVGRVSRFLVTALRRVRLVALGTPAAELPHLGALMLEGPSGCGKTFIVETACSELGGIPSYTIDGSTITGAGWRGGDLEDHEYRIAKMQAARGAGPIVVFVDEADKLAKGGEHTRDGFDPCELFLRLIEGDDAKVVDAPSKSGETGSLLLDKSALIFVFAGAFTGLDELVRKRLVVESGGVAAGFSADAGAMGALSLGGSELRARSAPEDLVSWGLPRELVGRITTLARVRPLSEGDLASVIRGSGDSVESRFSRMMPPGCSFSIDDDAVAWVARTEVSSGRGARGAEAALTPVFCDAVELAETDSAVVSVAVTRTASGLGLNVEKGERDAPEEADNEGVREGYGLESGLPPCFGPKEAGWLPPRRVDAPIDNLAHISVRLRMSAGKGSPDPLVSVRSCRDAREMATAITDVALSCLTAEQARVAWELVYGCLAYILEWGAPGDMSSDVLLMLLGEAADGKLMRRVLELWDGRSRSCRGAASRLRCGTLAPGRRSRRGCLEYCGIDPGTDSALKHILFYRALAGRGATKTARRVADAVSLLVG